MTMLHRPVLLDEVLEQLNLEPDGIYIDGTFGRGGHSQAILQRLGANGKLLAIDKDALAIHAAQQQGLTDDPRFYLRQGSFTQLHHYVSELGWLGKVNGMLLDLGVSSPQLDDAARGFSFLRDGPLDMRMDAAQPQDAQQWINNALERDIIEVLKTYGEERYARRIAAFIVAARQQTPITTTGQLADIVAKAHPRWEPHKHPATRTFQAIRIFINHELDELREVLQQSLDLLASGGRLLVISFHSLEDKVVKQFIQAYGSTAHLPRDIPLTNAQLQTSLRLKRINGAIRASSTEITENPRARSAILRIMEKIK
jgi:16S rRNA (cytosine1402-N4)-methyltransferase